ncbi:MAG: flagellar biosynthesis protein FlhA [Bdellovibrionota bacterium]
MPTNDNQKSTFLKAFATPDIQLAIGLIAIIFMMIIPLHPIILDALLAVSITLGFLILLVSIYVTEPLHFSTFPTLLLIATLFRLGLNVATTRSILLDGGTGNVSNIVKSFGNFVVGGNYFVGFVIFAILVIINFVVITKGAGRVAEVGARFTLDAMPGKQMSIDADMNAGIIDREEAKHRRQKIEQEADFYGAMDGASKFVRGDAIAGIIITSINIIVGLLVGVLQHNMNFSQSAEIFTLLTVGDGLVSQIPALIISVAAGIVVTRANGDGALSNELSGQILLHPKAIYICSVLLALIALIPGLPFIPFLLLSIGCWFLGNFAKKETLRIQQEKIDANNKETNATTIDPDSIESLLQIDTLALEVGVGLIPLVDAQQDGEVLERIVSTRKQFAQDMGIIVPMIMVRDNIQLKPGEYQILLKGNPIANGTLMADYLLAMAPDDITDPIDGVSTKEPAYGLDAVWIKKSQKDEASFRGYTVVNCATVIVTHLTKVVQENAAALIGRQEVQNLVDGIKDQYPKVIEEAIGNTSTNINLGTVVKILQNLLNEGVSIKDLLTILETIADHCKNITNPDALTRYVRIALGRGIVGKYLSHEKSLVTTSLDRGVEDLLISGLHQHEDGSTSLNIDPEIAQRLLNNIADTMKRFDTRGTIPILMCGSRIRWDLKKIVNRFIPGLTVLAFDEIPSDLKTENIGIVTI